MGKPQLVSQAAAPAEEAEEEDWGDDGCDMDLMVAASQLDQPVPAKPAANEEDLLAMTALMGDDDFNLEDMEAAEGEGVVEAERLNQTMTVFPEQQREEKVAMAPPRPLARAEGAARREEERLRQLSMKLQGEAAFLRGELGRKEKEVEAERLGRRKVEAELGEKVVKEQKAREAEVAKVTTEKMFLLQEMRGMKERMQAEEAASQRSSQVVRKEVRRPSGFPEDKPRPKVARETQTESPRPRSGRLRRAGTVTAAAARSVCRAAALPAVEQTRLLLAATPERLAVEVRGVTGRVVAALRQEGEVAPRLAALRSLLDNCGADVTAEQCTAITKICSDLLSGAIKEKSSAVLPEVLEVLVAAWRTELQRPDVTAYVLSLLARLLTASAVPLPESPAFLATFFTLVRRVAEDPAQAQLLCGDGQEACFLSCVPLLAIAITEAGNAATQSAAATALARWLLAVASLDPTPPYLSPTYPCRWCCSGLVAAATHLTKVQVRRLLATKEEAPGRAAGLPVLRDCLSALSRQQEVLRGGVHGEDTAWMELINAGAGLQRNYMWTMEQARTLAAELGEETAARLEMLVLEQQDDSEAMDS